MKVLLILADGMRPDSFADLPKAQEIVKRGTSTMSATTVTPAVTLPCHMSLFHSIDPSRHGTTTNVYAPQVRPVKGLFDVLSDNKKWGAMYFGWHELRDVVRPSNLLISSFHRGKVLGYDKVDAMIAQEVVRDLNDERYDISLTFAYLGEPDAVGHKYGWMSAEYLEAVERSWDNIETMLNGLPEDYTVIITADHGGHDRTHGNRTPGGNELPEDITIPLIAIGKDFLPGATLDEANIKDIAPTVVKLLGVEPDEDWDGKSLI